MLRYLPLLLLLGVAGCEEPYKAIGLYQATTPDCKNWSEGSRFDLPEGIRVFASTPSPIAAAARAPLDLALTYFVPRGGDVKFSGRDFNLTAPHGPVAARGLVTSVFVKASGADKKADLLETLPMLLRSAASVEETSFRVNLRFSGQLPERFDLTPPPMILDGKTYPVRTYTYRLFKEKNAYGLCT